MIINNLAANNDENQINYVEAASIAEDGSRNVYGAAVICEHTIQVYINEQHVYELTCTGSDLAELVCGRMLTEGIIESLDMVEHIYICEDGLRANVLLKSDIDFEKKLYKEPTCCIMNKTLLAKTDRNDYEVLSGYSWKIEWIFNLANIFAADSKIHRQTSGTHSCYLACNGAYVASFEDIGRHNALDKAIGYALINKINLNECILYTTGRVPTDMVQKAIMAKVPVLVSKSVPTDMAVEMAKKYKLTLICRAWPDKFEVMSDGSINS